MTKFLDFDGVIVDSIDECYKVSLDVYFQSKDFEKIIILCIDEILTKKYNIDIDHEKLEIVMNLVKNSYLIKTTFIRIKDTFLKIYYKYKCKFCIGQNDDDVIDSEI